jgi:hypothetical protein
MDNVDQLFKVGEIMGTEDIRKYVKRLGLKPDVRIQQWLQREDFPKVPLHHFQTKDNLHIASDMAIDLLDKMLRIDHVPLPASRSSASLPLRPSSTPMSILTDVYLTHFRKLKSKLFLLFPLLRRKQGIARFVGFFGN